MFGVRIKHPNCYSKFFGLYCRRICRNQSTGIFVQKPPYCIFADARKAASPINLISPALLARARSISAEHAQLSKKLDNEFDVTLARKVGELSIAVKALENWEVAHNVCMTFAKESICD